MLNIIVQFGRRKKKHLKESLVKHFYYGPIKLGLREKETLFRACGLLLKDSPDGQYKILVLLYGVELGVEQSAKGKGARIGGVEDVSFEDRGEFGRVTRNELGVANDGRDSLPGRGVEVVRGLI